MNSAFLNSLFGLSSNLAAQMFSPSVPRATSRSGTIAGLCKPQSARIGVARFLIALIAAARISGAWAQSVTDTVPSISFADLELVSREVGAEHFAVRFPSPVSSGIEENDTQTLHVFLPTSRSGPVNAVVILHYWGATDHRVEFNTALELARKGMAGIVVALPYHLERTPPGVRSGQLAITPDPDRLRRTMVQAILDLKRTADWIESRPEFQRGRIGITGASLGAIVATLAVGVETRYTDAAFVVGGVDIAGVLWKSSRVVKEREELRRLGYTEAKLREVLEPIEPLRYISANSLKSAYVVGAKYDTVVPRESVEKLIASLESPYVHWLETGHYGGFLIQKRVQNSVAEYFRRSFAGLPFETPVSLDAPTIRLGITTTNESGFKIGAGIDILRPNRERDPFVTAFFTPRSGQLIAGFSVGNGLSIGAVLTPKRLSPGLFWSIVL